MNRRAIVLLLLLAATAGTAAAQDKVGTTAASFLGIGMGARAMGMGGAQVASAEGPSALYWNPAAVAGSETNAAEFSYASWLVGTSFQNAAVTLNAGGLGHFGLSFLALNYGEMEVTTELDEDGTGEIFTPVDLAVGVSYARSLTDRFSVGGTVKYVRQTIWNTSAGGVALDVGVVYALPFQNMRIGMSMSNFGSDMRISGKDLRRAIDIDPNQNGNNPRLGANLETDAWPMPLVFRVGLAVDALRGAGQRLTVEADGLHMADNSESANLGLEYAFRDFFFVRGGFNQAFSAVTEDSGWTLGAGLQFAASSRLKGRFDYTYQYHQRLGSPQMFSVGLTF